MFLTASIASLGVAAADKDSDAPQIWSCKALLPPDGENVLWLVDSGESSYVKVFGERIPALYHLEGLEKRWDWGEEDDGSYRYSLVLHPDLTAAYYDFGPLETESFFDFSFFDDGGVEPSAIYRCSK